MSWGGACDQTGEFSIITDVSSHFDFIDHAITQLEDVNLEPFGSETEELSTGTLLSMVTSGVYSCPNPIDSFEVVRNPTVPATIEWPWLAVFHNQCAAVLVGAHQLLTSTTCCGSPETVSLSAF